MWFGTNEGLNKYDGIKFTIYRWDVNDKTTISADLIRGIIEDRSNRLWISTEAVGLNMYDRNKDQFIRYTIDSSFAIRLINSDINSIAEDHDGNIWLGTREGIILFNLEKRVTKSWLVYPDRGANSYWNLVNDICIDKNNVLWIGTYGGAQTSFSLRTNKFEHFRHNSEDPKSLSND